MKASVHVRLDTKSEKNASVVCNRLVKLWDIHLVSIEQNHDGEMEAWFDLQIHQRDWPNIVFELLQHAQSVGSGWQLSNAIEEEIDVLSTRISVSGIRSIGIQLSRLGTMED